VTEEDIYKVRLQKVDGSTWCSRLVPEIIFKIEIFAPQLKLENECW
jgi:hypothetical protein